MSLVLPVYIPFIAGTIAWGMLIPVLPLYLAEVGLSVRVIGLVLGAAGLGATLGGLPAGSLISRIGEKPVALGSLFAIGLAVAVMGLAEAAIALIVLQMTFGVGTAGLRLACQTAITKRVESGIRGRAMAMMGGSVRVGFFLGPLIGGILVDLVGFTSTFLVAGVLTTVGLLSILRQSTDDEVLSNTPRLGERRNIVQTLLPHRKLLAKTVMLPILVLLVREGRQTVLPLIGEDLELSATAVGAVVAIGAAADLLLFPVSGQLMDRFGRLWGMVPAFGLIALGLIALGFAWFASSVVGVILAGVLMGVGNGMSSGAILTLGSDLAPSDATAEFLAGLAAVQSIGRILGPIVVGVVAAASSLGWAAISLSAFGTFAILWLVLVIGETRTPVAS